MNKNEWATQTRRKCQQGIRDEAEETLWKIALIRDNITDGLLAWG